MIYFSSNGNLSNNIILPKDNSIEDLRNLRNILVKDYSKRVSASFVDMALIGEKIQREKNINLGDFFSDNCMFSSLHSAFSKLNYRYAYYILENLSSDYECFVSNIYDRILFKEIESYSISDLESAHRLNERFGIKDCYFDLLSNVNVAEKNSMILQLTRDIKDKTRNKS